MHVLVSARRVMDFCYPGACACCEADCEPQHTLCDACLAALENLESQAACLLCAMPLPMHNSPCPYCQGAGIAHLDRIPRLGAFEDPIKHLVHQMKYHRRWNVGEFLADRMLQNRQIRDLLERCDRVVPVPLHFFRQVSRGFNQADVIARRLGRKARRKVVRALVRLRNTPTQTNLSIADRADNVRDAFGLVKPRAVRGRNLVLVDDVMTTGATLRAAALVLQEAKPASISAIVIARADPKHRGFDVI